MSVGSFTIAQISNKEGGGLRPRKKRSRDRQKVKRVEEVTMRA